VKHLLLLSLMIAVSCFCFAQTPNFTVTTNSDSTNLDATFEVKFTIDGGQGTAFQQPEFNDFDIVYQNQSTQMNITNGEMQQKVSYTFGLRAKAIGTYVIEKASVEIEGKMYATDFVKIVVDENYIPKSAPKSNNNFWSPFGDFPQSGSPKPKAKPKKKRKVYKI